jgi:ribosome biogenesis protein ENP2
LAKMQVTTAGGVKVYNLSAGKSLPEWISERKRRALLKNDLGQNLYNNSSIT